MGGLSDIFYAHASKAHGRKASVPYTAKSKLNYDVCKDISAPYTLRADFFIGEIKHITSKIGLVVVVATS